MELFIGAVVSLIVQGIKRNTKLSTWGKYVTVALISFVGAGIYTQIKDTSLWGPLVGVFVSAGAFYAYILRRFEE